MPGLDGRSACRDAVGSGKKGKSPKGVSVTKKGIRYSKERTPREERPPADYYFTSTLLEAMRERDMQHKYARKSEGERERVTETERQ